MLVKENTIPLNHVGARPSAGSATQKVEANQKGKLRNGPPRRFLVIGAVIAVFAIFFGIRYWMYASSHEDTEKLRAPKPKLPWRKLRTRNSNFPTVPSSLPFPGASPKKRFKPGTAFQWDRL
jgi:hypothetical protein